MTHDKPAVAADQTLSEAERARARLSLEILRLRDDNARLEAERDRLRAVLAEAATIVEETDVVEAPRGETYYAQLGDARATLWAAAAALRARAGVEP